MKRDWLIIFAILIIIGIGIAGFFVFVPPVSKTVDNFIGYTSSLSTIVMVLIYIAITTRQLNVMRNQLGEMVSTRILQTAPLPYIKPSDKCHIEAPKFWTGPPDWKLRLHCRLHFYANVENIGNGTAVAIDIIPKLKYKSEDGKTVVDQVISERIESLKEDESQEISCMFVRDLKHRVIKTFLFELPENLPSLEFTMLYKNVLGGSFRAKTEFDIWFYDEDEEKLKSCLKILQTAKIDYADMIRKHDSFEVNDDKAIEIRSQLDKELSKIEGCKDIDFVADPTLGSFSVTPISEEEYISELQPIYPRRLGMTRENT